MSQPTPDQQWLINQQISPAFILPSAPLWYPFTHLWPETALPVRLHHFWARLSSVRSLPNDEPAHYCSCYYWYGWWLQYTGINCIGGHRAIEKERNMAGVEKSGVCSWLGCGELRRLGYRVHRVEMVSFSQAWRSRV